MATPIPRLNYQHLLYFWVVVRSGSLTRACSELHLSVPTVSAQLRTFEERIGEQLLVKSGRTLVPTEMGRVVYGYAEEIFGLGADLLDALAQRPTRRPLRLTIGIDAVVPREIVRRLLQASLKFEQPVQLVCRDGSLESLLGELQVRRIDVILSDSPVTPSLGLRAYNHELGGCDVSWMAVPALARPLRNGFPRSLDGVKMLLPTPNTAIRRSLDQWFDRHGIHPQVVGEFQDYGLLREFARAGHGVAPVPNVLLQQYRKDAGLSIIGPARRVQAEFHLISMERRIRHPAVLAISEKAEDIFDNWAR